MTHVDEACQLADLCMVNDEVGATGAGSWEIVKWPAVSEVHMVVEI